MVISTIAGTAGVQLYVNLRGFDPAGSIMDPAEALQGFLDVYGIPPERIPISLDGKTALYRTLLAGKRVLVVLDNARNVDQIRQLLPGSSGCLALVTSRNQLTSLVTTEGAQTLALDLLTAAEARELLGRRLGQERIAAEPEAVNDIIKLCARLPLTLAIVAACAITRHGQFPLAALAGELRETRGSLDALADGDKATDIRAVFSWSYQRLSVTACRLFRILGLHPGPDFTTAAAASLAGFSPAQIRPALAELTDAHLITAHIPGRFSFHDLLRAYAAEQARTTTFLDYQGHGHDQAATQRAALDAARLIGSGKHMPIAALASTPAKPNEPHGPIGTGFLLRRGRTVPGEECARIRRVRKELIQEES